jgi:hypothetical protein
LLGHNSGKGGTMHFSQHSLHPPVIISPDHKIAVAKEFASIAGRQPLKGKMAAPSLDSLALPLTTVSLNSNFDAYIDVQFKGAPAGSTVQLLVDSGNSMLIMPRWEDIAALPNSGTDYQILGTGPEPWGCPANVVRGPIDIATTSGDVYTLQNCVFYACTGDANGSRTANFGAGCLSPWTASGWNSPPGVGVTMQAPLSYNSSYPYAEFNYAPSANIYGPANTPKVAAGSYLTVHKVKPPGYTMFDIIPNIEWMALIAKGLSIGDTRTQWPGTAPSPIAMIDTGGGPVFLSDPNGYVYSNNWPDPVPNPGWTSDSLDCQSTSDDIAIKLGDETNSASYKIDPSLLPPTVRGLTFVMCKKNSYMMDQQGMNVGGISALVNYILVDYAKCQVGLKPK